MTPGETELLKLLKEMQATQAAHGAAIHAILKAHPQLESIANDYMARMDALADAVSEESVAAVSGSFQLILSAMTAELNRRRNESNRG